VQGSHHSHVSSNAVSGAVYASYLQQVQQKEQELSHVHLYFVNRLNTWNWTVKCWMELLQFWDHIWTNCFPIICYSTSSCPFVGSREAEEDGSLTAAQHLLASGDWPHAQSAVHCEGDADRLETGHRRYNHY